MLSLVLKNYNKKGMRVKRLFLFLCLFFSENFSGTKKIAKTFHSKEAEKVFGTLVGAAIGSSFGRWQKEHEEGIEAFLNNKDKRVSADQQISEVVLKHAFHARQNDVAPSKLMKKMAYDFIKWSYLFNGGRGSNRYPRESTLRGCMQLDNMVKMGYQKINARWWATGSGVNFAKMEAFESDIGSAVHAYPFGVVFYSDMRKAQLFAVEHSLLTHRSKEAKGASSAMAMGVAAALKGETVLEISQKMVRSAGRHSPTLLRSMSRALEFIKDKKGPSEVFSLWKSSKAVDVMASILFLFNYMPNDLVGALHVASLYSTDLIAVSMGLGALIGAHSGIWQIDEELIATVENIDGIMHSTLLLSQ